MKEENNEILTEALQCIHRGWYVIPIHGIVEGKCTCNSKNCRSPGKHPIIRNWPEKASNNSQVVIQWWKKYPEANLGVLTGIQSGIMVVDVDPRNGGNESLKKLVKEYGALPHTIQSHTGGDGDHFFFKCDSQYIKCKCNFRPGIDIKANGGYIVVPPSKHISKENYYWVLTSHTQNMRLAEPPKWLSEQLNEINNKFKYTSTNIINGKIREGERNNTLTSYAGSLRRKGLSQETILKELININKKKCDPPLPTQEVEKICKSISRYKPAISLREQCINNQEGNKMKVLLNLLRADGSLIINKHLANKIGLHAAIIYSELISKYLYFEKIGNLVDQKWFYNTIKNLEKDTTLTQYQQKKAIKELEKIELITTQLKGIPAKRYFRIEQNEELIRSLLV